MEEYFRSGIDEQIGIRFGDFYRMPRLLMFDIFCGKIICIKILSNFTLERKYR